MEVTRDINTKWMKMNHKYLCREIFLLKKDQAFMPVNTSPLIRQMKTQTIIPLRLTCSVSNTHTSYRK